MSAGDGEPPTESLDARLNHLVEMRLSQGRVGLRRGEEALVDRPDRRRREELGDPNQLAAEQAGSTPGPQTRSWTRSWKAAFLRSDELPERTAWGYLEMEGRSRTNTLHLPVRGSGDGGLYATVADVGAFWPSLLAGKVVPTARVADMVRPRSELRSGSARYGLGFWLPPSSSAVYLEGVDAGVSFRSVHDPRSQITHTVISNTSGGVCGPSPGFSTR